MAKDQECVDRVHHQKTEKFYLVYKLILRERTMKIERGLFINIVKKIIKCMELEL